MKYKKGEITLLVPEIYPVSTIGPSSFKRVLIIFLYMILASTQLSLLMDSKANYFHDTIKHGFYK